MSQLVAKLMLALLMLPSAAAIYVVGFIIGMELFSWNEDVLVFSVIGGLALGYIAVYWLLLWRRTIVWTPQRTSKTVAVSFAALFAGAIVGIIGGAAIHEASFGIFLATVIAVLAWLLGTVLVWRETDEERMTRVRNAGVGTVVCASCGYNLTGLTHTRCPECGAEPTIEDLLACQPSCAERELVNP